MATSQNGWSASPNLPIVPLVVNGIEFVPGVRAGAVHTVLGYVAQQVADRVEKPVNPGCWGFSFRANANNPNSLSNHSSATAIDFNAPKHPNGVPTSRTFTNAQTAEIHRILTEVDGVVRWGGDFQITPDAMHFEIDADRDAVNRVAAKLHAQEDPLSSPEALAKLDRIETRLINLANRERDRFGRLKDMLKAIDTALDDDPTPAQLRVLKLQIKALVAALEEEQ